MESEQQAACRKYEILILPDLKQSVSAAADIVITNQRRRGFVILYLCSDMTTFHIIARCDSFHCSECSEI